MGQRNFVNHKMNYSDFIQPCICTFSVLRRSLGVLERGTRNRERKFRVPKPNGKVERKTIRRTNGGQLARRRQTRHATNTTVWWLAIWLTTCNGRKRSAKFKFAV